MSLQEVREQNIALVTQTALACFVENGIDKTTIRDIAHRAGLTERSVYRRTSLGSRRPSSTGIGPRRRQRRRSSRRGSRA